MYARKMGGAPAVVKIILAVSGLSSIWYDNSHLRYFGVAIAAITALPLLGETTYTKISLYVTLAAAFHEWGFPQRRRLFAPFLLVNFLAVSVSFHFAILLDPTACGRVARLYGWSTFGFHCRNFVIHILPVVLIYWWIRRYQAQYKEMIPASPCIGLCTATVHLLWALLNVGSLDLSHVYIHFPVNDWNYMWCVAVGVHVLSGCCWKIIL